MNRKLDTWNLKLPALAGLLVILLSAFHSPHAAFAVDSPLVIPFQGQVTDQQNQSVPTGQYSLIFNLYDVAIGGQPLWTERHTKVGVTNGMVNLFLGSITSLSGVDFSQTRYLGITVDVDHQPTTPDPEMVPRQMIIPAFHAKKADEATNSSKLSGYNWSSILTNNSNNPTEGYLRANRIEVDGISGAQIAPAAVGGTEVANNAISTNHIADGSITVADLVASVQQALAPPGTIVAFAGRQENVPAGWMLCDGRSLSRTTHASLFAAIGTNWGSGDGSSTFIIPNLKGVFLRGVDYGVNRDPDRASRGAQAPGGSNGDQVGSFQDSAFQGFEYSRIDQIEYVQPEPPRASVRGVPEEGNSGSVYTTYSDGIRAGFQVRSAAASPRNNGSHGEPRMSTETRPTNASVNYIIKF